MYNAIWKKYLSVIHILFKRAAKEDQVFQLNASDFERTGPQKKTGFDFLLKFNNGKVDDIAGLSVTAKEFAAVLQQDGQVGRLLAQGSYHVGMNKKFQLSIQQIHQVPAEAMPLTEVEAG